MKKYFDIVKFAAAALGLLLFAACMNPLTPPANLENDPAAISEGKGLVRIASGTGAARTAMPAAVFDHFEWFFSKDGGPSELLTPLNEAEVGEGGNARFELDPGEWTLELKAYAGPGDDTLTVTGNGGPFTVTAGQEIAVTVNLSPVVSEGTGTLNYTLSYPSGATVDSFTLTRIAGVDDLDLKTGALTDSTALTGTKTVGSGYYLAYATLQKDGITAGKTEVAHIYKNMSTDLTLAFGETEFRAIPVISSADAGPGTLRDAIANAPAGATVVITLPANDNVITLRSSLSIDKSLTIEGNGATITQLGLTSSLLRATGYSGVSVTLRRLRFVGGRSANYGGAINTGAQRLTLQSCIFSDNQAKTNGGAVYADSNGGLVVYGCTFYGNTAGGSGGAIRQSGSISFGGNVFWGNTAASFPVMTTGTNIDNQTYGFNVTDAPSGKGTQDCGWTYHAAPSPDKQAAALPFSPVSFRPLGGLGDAGLEGLITVHPSGYPTTDFYGRPIPETGAAAGAAQTPTAAGGYVLDYAPVGPGTVNAPGAAIDADGLTSGNVSLTAVDTINGVFRYWIVNGEKDPEPSSTISLTIGDHTTVRAVFYTKVTALSGSGTGSLREALLNAGDGGVVLPEGQTITLNSRLEITTNLEIVGNGATLNLNGNRISNDAGTTKVRISRVHFKGGRVTGSTGGAISNNGNLTLESCIFSDNQASGDGQMTGSGGAIFTNGNLTVLGCTFYGNTSGYYCGAIYKQSGTLTLQGNLFWGNTSTYRYPVVYDGPTSLGFNLSDQADGAGYTESGWTFTNGDAQAASLPLNPVSFKPFTGGEALGLITERPADYPTVDFYGEPIPETGAAAGAVQTPIALTGWVVDYAAQGPGTVAAEGLDENGFVQGGSVTLTASEIVTGAVEGTFRYWTVDGVEETTQTGQTLTLSSISAHTSVRAVFVGAWTASSPANDGEGSLREALGNAQDGDRIILAGQTITLTEPLDPIAKNLVIEGNGSTLTQKGFNVSATSQLFYIDRGGLSVSRLWFKGGRVTTKGGAIYVNRGSLTLESCIFTDNQATDASGNGGAVCVEYTLASGVTISGCTFYGNKAGATSGYGAAIRGFGTNPGGTFTGNIFWGNTAYGSPVVYPAGLSSGGFNLSDKGSGTGTGATVSGWAFIDGDTQASSQPVSSVSFRLLPGSEASGLISTRPGNYPTEDFYGNPIPSNGAAAGAVQAVVQGQGYLLDYAAQGPGTVTLVSGSVDPDGLADGNITLRAAPAAGAVFRHWTIDGTSQTGLDPANELPLGVLTGPKIVRAVFAAVYTVSNGGNDGYGSLRDALGKAQDGDIIDLAGQTITLTTVLDPITKSLTIEGNGATLTQSGITAAATSQLLYINSASAEVYISRVWFKGGRATTNGGAIYNNLGKLSLESCIFTDNRTTNASGYGGAISTSGTAASLTVSACTFYGNTAGTTGGRGGAIYKASGTATLTGNIFWGNTASNLVVYGTPVSGGFNVSDKADGTTATASGWNFTNGDVQAFSQPVSSLSFKPFAGGAAFVITSAPAGYPAVDFYGAPIPSGSAAAGAVQTTPGPGYYLDYAAQGPGTLNVYGADADGISPGHVILMAQAAADGDFMYWTVNGIKHSEPSDVLTLDLSADTVVRAVFYIKVSAAGNAGAGSLRQALADVADGGGISLRPAGGTITLTAAISLSTSKTFVIEGNGATLTQSGITAGANTQLLRFDFYTSVPEIRISRLHFKSGRATSNGAALYVYGVRLTLESCIFSDNQTTNATGQGGAVHISGTTTAVTVSGCTFYGNTAGTTGGLGGVIYKTGGTLTFTGNIFRGNTANQYSVLRSTSGTTTSGGFNVSDKPDGTDATDSGWTFATGPEADTEMADLDFAPDFTPSGAELPGISPLPAGFPETYFDGTTRGSYSAPGAMPSN